MSLYQINDIVINEGKEHNIQVIEHNKKDFERL